MIQSGSHRRVESYPQPVLFPGVPDSKYRQTTRLLTMQVNGLHLVAAARQYGDYARAKKEKTSSDRTRRRFLKTSAMAGAAATGVIGFSGTAAAQTLEISQITGKLLPRDRALVRSVQLTIPDATTQGVTPSDIGDVNINLGGSLINIQDVDITVIGGDLIIDVDVENVILTWSRRYAPLWPSSVMLTSSSVNLRSET